MKLIGFCLLFALDFLIKIGIIAGLLSLIGIPPLITIAVLSFLGLLNLAFFFNGD